MSLAICSYRHRPTVPSPLTLRAISSRTSIVAEGPGYINTHDYDCHCTKFRSVTKMLAPYASLRSFSFAASPLALLWHSRTRLPLQCHLLWVRVSSRFRTVSFPQSSPYGRNGYFLLGTPTSALYISQFALHFLFILLSSSSHHLSMLFGSPFILVPTVAFYTSSLLCFAPPGICSLPALSSLRAYPGFAVSPRFLISLIWASPTFAVPSRFSSQCL